MLEDGKVNWDVMKPSDEVEEQTEEESEESSFSISLKKLSIDDLTVIYDDRQGGMYAEMRDLDATCSGDMTSDNTTIRLKAQTPAVTFRMGGVPFLNKAKVGAKMDVDADLKNMKFTLRENSLSLNAIEAADDISLVSGHRNNGKLPLDAVLFNNIL